MHRLGEVSLFLEQQSVFEEGIGNEVGVSLELPGLGDDKLQAFLSLEWRLHVFEAHGLKQVDQANVFRVILPGTYKKLRKQESNVHYYKKASKCILLFS